MGTARRKPTPLLIVFMDLGRFAAHSQRVEDSEIAETLDSYYQRVAMLESIGITPPCSLLLQDVELPAPIFAPLLGVNDGDVDRVRSG